MPSLPNKGKKRPWTQKKKAGPWGENTEIYHKPQWRKARREFLDYHAIEKDGQRITPCKLCLKKGRITRATVVDHKVPVSKGGSFWDRDNWQCLCRYCHNKKTRDENN